VRSVDKSNVWQAISEHEVLVEAFKSRNALLQNSLSFFAHTIEQFDGAGNQRQNALSAEAGKLANAMLRFVHDPRADIASDVNASLARLVQWTGDDGDPGVAALVSHGRLIVALLPAVDDSVTRLLAGATTERLGALDRRRCGAADRRPA